MLPVIAVLGPTASGKSDFAVTLCERVDGELISVDSAQVYRGMDIGTAKPGAADRARVPHHLLDIRDPAEAYSAAAFAADAERLIGDVRARGRVPVLAGGTMLYFRALFAGLSDLPPADPELRAGIAARANREGWPALHAELARLDPESAARLHPNDSARIQRALEITRAGGAPASQRRGGGSRPSLGPLCVVRWQPYDRAALRERIAERFDAMLAAGLVDEVAALRARSDIHADLPSMRAVGYRQIWRHLDGELDREAARAAGIKATRLLAKRQSTWLGGGLVERALVREGDAVFNVRERADEIAVLSSCEQEVATRR
ncbi:tRNA (adenosine(37)-N6)-dimethylallyltransferase MiaA [Algiphilus sp.]|uniref:tRNA (adenosine(37)-N6)-dimethylallyltransferase MiaA n=1 Tax=Algiphilus sp. TaxID=1872431 RepID=UPI0025BBF6D4|nr:tRNA (adenosine(37)-N6)-dimethylallyltransferase MiaA [Algiphilus sp.]MCK5769620.1 tRNA (adenosine(37)-N6)-dimethylallyltransferase MiaA [Algiphilus sp.]